MLEPSLAIPLHGRTAGHRHARRSHLLNRLCCRADASMLVACSQVASGQRNDTLLLGGADDRKVCKGELWDSFKAARVWLCPPRAALPRLFVGRKALGEAVVRRHGLWQCLDVHSRILWPAAVCRAHLSCTEVGLAGRVDLSLLYT